MTDGVVQVAADGVGKKVDTSELTRPDTTVVERQRIVIADDCDPNRRAAVTAEGLAIDGMARLTFLLERQNALLAAIALQLGCSIDPDHLMKG